MSIPTNQLVFAGTWLVTKTYPQFQFVISPIDGKSYVQTYYQPVTGGTDPSVQPSPYWVIMNPVPASTPTGLQSLAINPSLFSSPATFTGPISKSLGSFTLPTDLLSGTTALLYLRGWGCASWGPTNNANLLDFRFGFGPVQDGGIPTWYGPIASFQVQAPNNANGVPLQIPNGIPHTPVNPNNVDYVQLPYYVYITNAQPGQTIYANIECAYTNDVLTAPSIYAPILIYTQQ